MPNVRAYEKKKDFENERNIPIYMKKTKKIRKQKIIKSKIKKEKKMINES